MDLQLYFRVLWRFRFLMAIGLLAALALSALSLVSVGPSGVSYRQQEVWSSSAKLLVSQDGFPEGRSITETAFDWGFTNTAYFTRAFKQQFGETPTGYRRSRATELHATSRSAAG